MRGKKLGNQLDMKVLFLPEVVDQFLELAQILYDKGYLNSNHSAFSHFLAVGANVLTIRQILKRGLPKTRDLFWLKHCWLRT